MLFIFLAIILILSAGCNKYQTDEANSFIGKANKNITNGNKIQKDMDKIQQKIDNLVKSKKGLKAAYKLSIKLVKLISNQKKYSKAAVEDFKKISKLDVPDDFKTYANMETNAMDSYYEGRIVREKIISNQNNALKRIIAGNINEKQLSKMIEYEKKLKIELEVQSKLYDKQKTAAKNFYNEKNLGKK